MQRKAKGSHVYNSHNLDAALSPTQANAGSPWREYMTSDAAKHELAAEMERERAAAEEIGQELLAFASGEIGIYEGEHPDSALDCIRGEFAAYSKAMWAIAGILNSGSARPDDVQAAVASMEQQIVEMERERADFLLATTETGYTSESADAFRQVSQALICDVDNYRRMCTNLTVERDQAQDKLHLYADKIERAIGGITDAEAELSIPDIIAGRTQRISVLESALREITACPDGVSKTWPQIDGIVRAALSHALPICEAPRDADAIKGLPVGPTDSEMLRKPLDIAVEALLRFDDIYADEALAAIRAAMSNPTSFQVRVLEGIGASMPICEAPRDAGAIKGLPVGAPCICDYDGDARDDGTPYVYRVPKAGCPIHAEEDAGSLLVSDVAPSEDKQ